MIIYIVRNAFKYWLLLKEYVIVGLVGLTFGVTSLSYLSYYVYKELSYDNWVPNKSNVYRLNTEKNFAGRPTKLVNSAPLPIVPFLGQNFEKVNIGYGLKRTYRVKNGIDEFPIKILFVNRDFVNIFPPKLVTGDIDKSLSNPLSIILTRKEAEDYYGATEVLGETFIIDSRTFVVGAVIENWPENSHISLDAIVNFDSPLLSDSEAYLQNWGSLGASIYLEYEESIDKQNHELIINQILSKSAPLQYGGFDLASQDSTPEYKFYLDELEDLYLVGAIESSLGPVGSGKLLILIFVVILFLLIVVIANFCILTSSFWSRRIRELVLRRLSGANKKQIIQMLVIENGMLVLVSIPFIVILIWFFYSYAIQFYSYNLNILESFTNLVMISFSFCFIIMGASLVTSLLKIYRGTYNETDALYHRSGLTYTYVFLTLQLIVFFTLSYLFLIVTKQADQLINFDLGFDHKRLEIVWDTNRPKVEKRIRPLSEKLSNIDGVSSVSFTNVAPGGGSQFSKSFRLPDGTVIPSVEVINVDFNYFSTVGIDFIQGRGFEKGRVLDSFSENRNDSNIVVNLEAAKTFGIDSSDLSVSHIYTPRSGGSRSDAARLNIIGVVENVYYRSPLKSAVPTVYVYDINNVSRMLVRYDNGQRQGVVSKLNSLWSEMIPSADILSGSVEDQIQFSYKNVIKQREVLFIAALIFAWLSMSGVFSISSMCVDDRKKETIIRKIFGEPLLVTIYNILKPIVASVIVGLFVSLVLTVVLEKYFLTSIPGLASSISFSPFFQSAGIVLTLIALTISLQIMRVIKADPQELMKLTS